MKRVNRTKSAPPVDAAALLPLAEFAERLKISVWTARSWAYSGKISSVRVGAKLLHVPASEIDRIINEGMRPRAMADRERG
jgi:predicted site-specific integrase-resolvase